MARQDKKNTWQPSIKLLSLLLVGITVIYVYTIYSINEKLEDQYKFNKEIRSESTQIKNPILEIKPDKAKKKFYLNEQDISDLNNHVEYLTKKLETEIDRNQRNAEYNIDRLNLFMALGIGFLALIGGLLPLAVNFISKHDIEMRLIKMEESAMASEKTLNESEKKMPTVDLLILQSSVSKLISTETLRLLSGNNQYNDIANIIQRVISALKLFESSDYKYYTDDNVDYLNEIFKELRLALKYGSLRKSPSITRSIHKQIDEIVIYLEANEVNTIKDFPNITNKLISYLTIVEKSFLDLSSH